MKTLEMLIMVLVISGIVGVSVYYNIEDSNFSETYGSYASESYNEFYDTFVVHMVKFAPDFIKKSWEEALRKRHKATLEEILDMERKSYDNEISQILNRVQLNLIGNIYMIPVKLFGQAEG